ncbi:hypothetical protein B0J14DRAFT_566395 [Halenospora varia]|nr:hypothetical protein B0J14DRAFT_566395 [Halenospora varia]
MSTVLTQSSPELSVALQDINTINQVIQSRTFPHHPPPRIPEPGREDLHSYLKWLTEHFWLSDYRARTWGFTILRTAYRPDNDSKFQHGIDVINQVVKMWNEVEMKGAARRGRWRGLGWCMRRQRRIGRQECLRQQIQAEMSGFGNGLSVILLRIGRH